MQDLAVAGLDLAVTPWLSRCSHATAHVKQYVPSLLNLRTSVRILNLLLAVFFDGNPGMTCLRSKQFASESCVSCATPMTSIVHRKPLATSSRILVRSSAVNSFVCPPAQIIAPRAATLSAGLHHNAVVPYSAGESDHSAGCRRNLPAGCTQLMP